MLELNKANLSIFRRKMVNIPIVTFSCFILSAILVYPPSASVAQSIHTCFEDISANEREQIIFCDGPAGQFLCLYGHSTSDLMCHGLACGPPIPGASLADICEPTGKGVKQQQYFFNCDNVIFGGEPFSCMGPYTY